MQIYNFKDKTVFIIGGSSGLGLEIAKGFLNSNANVIIGGRSLLRRKNAVKIINREFGYSPFSVSTDVESESSVQHALDLILKKYHSIDVLVNTAGAYLKLPALDMTIKQWKHIIDVNLTGTYNADMIIGRHMVKQKKGNIINIASLGGKVALSKTLAYNVSKSGVLMLTQSLACEWAKYGVRVNAIIPGVFHTPLNSKALRDKERVENILRSTPMKRFGKLHEIVSSALFLASDSSSFVTGTSVAVDGGFLAYAGF